MIPDNSPPGFRIVGGVNGPPQIRWLTCLTCRVLVDGRESVEHRERCDRVTAMLAMTERLATRGGALTRSAVLRGGDS